MNKDEAKVILSVLDAKARWIKRFLRKSFGIRGIEFDTTIETENKVQYYLRLQEANNKSIRRLPKRLFKQDINSCQVIGNAARVIKNSGGRIHAVEIDFSILIKLGTIFSQINLTTLIIEL